MKPEPLAKLKVNPRNYQEKMNYWPGRTYNIEGVENVGRK
jgi:hypothetical protein